MDTEKVRYTLGQIAGMAEELADILDEPDIEDGQYWQWNAGRVFRVQSVHIEAKRCRIRYLNEVEKDWHWNGILEDATLLSDDEIEEALIKEYKERGGGIGSYLRQYKDNEKSKISGEPCLKDNGSLIVDTEEWGILWVYKPYKEAGDFGDWAEIITDEWEAVHKHTTDTYYVRNNNTEQVICTRRKNMNKKQAEEIRDALNNMED